ncbi:Protein N-acetyltransferase, RimJ/RimL family [Flavobacterium sp. CF108]|uniref:GNAT family N-acetyltransferase n=1 Tax=unclassified Flavobacterium TaxID=196869 RepID=UPI0008D52361|nr:MULTISPECIES: GNAT family N-acetyltransferase [unclassified Flavobacterium]SEO71338.1 Protein N-acetyltransferase, RimJ/RimL family [Flavobacterium sp. fv08]SHH91457.1 Protein N-acetyltransferase, RimJ/RimL family [Flavobacterium sp. CF108]
MNSIITHPENDVANDVVFVKTIPGLGVFELRPLDMELDIPLIHNWVNRDYAVYWEMNGFSVEEVKNTYYNIQEKAQVYIGKFNNNVAFLLECYDPKDDIVGKYYEAEKGDKGMHILVAPSEKPIPNFTWNIFTVILDFIFSDAKSQRIVVEPDARNHKIHLLNKRAGFIFQRVLDLPHKQAHLEFCTREDYYKALQQV